MANKNPKKENLIPLNKRAKEAQRIIQSKGGKVCAEKKREQILMSRIMADYLMEEHEVVIRDDDGKVLDRSKMTAKDLINRTITGILAREDAASGGIIKTLAEITEGKNINLTGGITILATPTDENL
jgi:hypothetical protein